MAVGVEDRIQAALADRYIIRRQIGSGGMALVFLARDERHNRDVALKVLRPELAVSVGADRFLREIQIEASLQHPHILPLYDSGEAEGFLYYTMPYVEGETLRDRIKREGRLSVDDVVHISDDVAEALSYAHEHGVVHRDVKPENILLSGDHALVTDFGVARALHEAGGEELTGSGVAIGTPTYMSPEQASGTTPADARSDVYSLGLVVYEMLVGEPPFGGTTPVAVLQAQVNQPLPSIEEARPEVPRQVRAVIEKALAKSPSDRFQTAVAFSVALSRSASGEMVVVPSRLKLKLHWRTMVATLAVAFVAVLVGWRLYTRMGVGLDPNVIVLYPLEWGGGAGEDGDGDSRSLIGENAAFLVVAWLDGRGSFTWVNGWDLIGEAYRADVRMLRHEEKSALAAAERAAFYVDGRAIPTGADSVRIVLELQRTRVSRPIARADTAGPINHATQLGVMAAAKLVLSLLPNGETVDVSDVGGTDPQAVQILVQAEREFHAARYGRALELYQEAVERDSTFALAGARGAQAASWNHDQAAAEGLIEVAVRHVDELAPRWAQFALGFQDYINARGDSAVYHFERAIDLSEDWAEGWMGLGEVYQHLLPAGSPQDSLARHAFEMVDRLSENFAPARYHLAEFAMREGDLTRASELVGEYRAADPDEDVLANLELALACLRDGPGAIDWRQQVLENVNRVYQAAKLLGVGAAQPDCAMAGWQAVLDYDTTTGNEAWLFSSLTGLQALLVATGDSDRLVALLDSAATSNSLSGPTAVMMYTLHAVVMDDSTVDVRGRQIADSLRALFPGLSETRLWFLALWDLHTGNLTEARTIRDTLRSAGERGSRRGELLGEGLAAHIALAEGDTARAVGILERLVPTSRRSSYMYPFESLGPERLALARIYRARGDYQSAYRVASIFDSPSGASVVYPMFLQESLELRLEAARELGDGAEVESIERRLLTLRRD